MKKCPYCAEVIQDEAIVCRYCGRNLEQPSHDLQRTNSRATADDKTAAKHDRGQPRPHLLSFSPILIAAALCSFFFFIFWAELASLLAARGASIYISELIQLILYYLCALPLGYWAGRAWPGQGWRTYILLGLSVGFMMWLLAMGHMLYGYLFAEITGPLFLVPRFVRFGLAAALVFFLGALGGDFVKRRETSTGAGFWTAAIGLAVALIGLLSAMINALQ